MRIVTIFVLSLAILISCGTSQEDKIYTINIEAVPAEAGTVTPASGEFESGRSLEISATANEHWVFSRWEGDHSGTVNPSVISMSSNKDIAAIFVKRDYPLTVLVEGEGSVGEEVVQERTTEYEHGTVVRLTPEPADGWEFNEWLGDAEGSENPLTITVEGETEVKARFTRIEHPVTLNIEGEGSVLSDGETLGTTESFPEGSTITLTAQPEEEWIFSSWSGDITSNENPIELEIDGPIEITATFFRTYNFTATSVPAEGGDITPASGDYIRNSTIEVTAEANPGWKFVDWEGDFTGTQNPFSLTMDDNKAITANFERKEYTLDLSEIEGQGTVNVTLVSGTETSDGYLFESVVELTANPSSDWRFVRWEGDLTGSDNPSELIIDNNKSVKAIFSFFEAGQGTEEDPYQIANFSQLNEVRNHLDDHFILINDIDASPTEFSNLGMGFMPIGNENSPFEGTFKGNGFTITDLKISRPNGQNIGLFGYILNGFVQNLTLQNVNITGGEKVGSVAGVNSGELKNIVVSGSVTGGNQVGGIAGRSIDRISSSQSAASVTGNDNTGGIVGLNEGQISASSSSGTVQGSVFRTGGLAGNNSGLVLRSFSTSNVNGDSMTGGLIGHNRGNGYVSESYATGDVSGNERVGGLVGRNDDGTPLVEMSYARGDVSGTSAVGGLVGSNSTGGSINQSYSTGAVSGTTDIGGFAGRNDSTITAGYWDTITSGQSNGVGLGNSSGIEGLETSEMSGSDAPDFMTEFDWVNSWKTTTGYPVQRWQ
tara:strand:+ start:32281 stop:34593 length:2313 start_codon:yes stop_codon:yes gene_type:complete